MRTLTCLLIVLGVSSSATAQTTRWIGGLDLLLPTYAERTADQPGPLVNVLGYDRDTGITSLLVVAERCHEDWIWRPTPGEGGIQYVVQLDVRLFALYHESGFLRVEATPPALTCLPLPPPPISIPRH